MTEDAKPLPGASETPPEPKVVFYIISFLVPLAGVILGAMYISKADAANKEFGRYCLVAALVNLGLGLMAAFCVIAFYISFIAALVGAAGAGALKGTFVGPWLIPK